MGEILQENSRKTGPKSVKRSLTGDSGLRTWAKPSGIKMIWGKSIFAIPCCTNAFSTNSDCKFAFCPKCHRVLQEGLATDQPMTIGRSSRRKVSNSSAASNTGMTHGTKNGGECGKHTIGDLNTMDHMMSARGHLAWKRKGTVGWENIATTCVKCGDEF